METLLGVSVIRVFMESGVTCFVLDMDAVSVHSVYVMRALDTKENSVIYRDVLDGQRIVVDTAHVT